jgi:xylan 1,4-beta-xylosidase
MPSPVKRTITPNEHWAHFTQYSYTGDDPWFDVPLAPGNYRNPILAGYYPDPSVCRAGDDYFLVCSSFGHFPGLPVFHSRNLVDWTPIGHAVDRPSQVRYKGLGLSQGLFAPTLREHGGVFYLVCTMVGAGGNFVMTARHPAGPWSDPVWLDCGGIDPALFFDDDGAVYLFHNDEPPGSPRYDGHRAIWAQRFDPESLSLTGLRAVIVDGGVDITQKPIWIEGPKVYKRGGWYYLSCAEGGTSEGHSQVIFRARSPMGVYEPGPVNPILTQRGVTGARVTSTGHAELVPGPDGEWWAAFLGCRPYDGIHYVTGRETFLLPVEWPRDDFPVILPPGRAIEPTAPRPMGTGSQPAMQTTGNGARHDDFAGLALAHDWTMLRAPERRWWRLTVPGLEIEARAERLNGGGNPSFLGRRIRHARSESSVSLQVPPKGVAAGIAVVQGDRHHVFFGVRRRDGSVEAFVERTAGGEPAVVATVALGTPERLSLRIRLRDGELAFTGMADDQPFVARGSMNARFLTTAAAGGFVGALAGPHAVLDDMADKG